MSRWNIFPFWKLSLHLLPGIDAVGKPFHLDLVNVQEHFVAHEKRINFLPIIVNPPHYQLQSEKTVNTN
jgi:tRNA1(Val) A37 N6-methylase TrmN6